jgi:hypothetical protein
MEADKTLDGALKTLDIPVSRAFRKVGEGKAAPRVYLTYQLIYGAGTAFADDDTEATESTWRVDLYSKDNYAATIPQIVRTLKAAEFYGVTVEAEQYEADTGYYHTSFEAKYFNMEAN